MWLNSADTEWGILSCGSQSLKKNLKNKTQRRAKLWDFNTSVQPFKGRMQWAGLKIFPSPLLLPLPQPCRGEANSLWAVIGVKPSKFNKVLVSENGEQRSQHFIWQSLYRYSDVETGSVIHTDRLLWDGEWGIRGTMHSTAFIGLRNAECKPWSLSQRKTKMLFRPKFLC